MKITKIVLMLVIGMFVSVGAFAIEMPADKITSVQSIYVAPNITIDLELDFRPLTVTGEHASNEGMGFMTSRAYNDGGKVEVGWQVSYNLDNLMK